MRQDSAIKKLLKIFLFIYFIYAKHASICNNNNVQNKVSVQRLSGSMYQKKKKGKK